MRRSFIIDVTLTFRINIREGIAKVRIFSLSREFAGTRLVKSIFPLLSRNWNWSQNIVKQIKFTRSLSSLFIDASSRKQINDKIGCGNCRISKFAQWRFEKCKCGDTTWNSKSLRKLYFLVSGDCNWNLRSNDFRFSVWIWECF